jgi:biopolymer transport protein ExbD
MRRKKSLDLLGDLNPDLNSLLDIVFILLIFTMLAMQLGRFQLLNLNFPEIESHGSTNEKINDIKIYLLENGNIRVNSKDYSLPNWENAIEENWKEKIVIIASEKQVPFERFVLILDRIRKIQPKSIELGIKEK